MARISFLGLGAMGRRMASRLAPHHDLVVWNRSAGTRIDGARRASTPADAVRDADVVFCMVTDDAASQAVWRGEAGALDAMRPGALAVECSTVSPAHALTLGQAAAERGLRFVDGPVAGSTPQAEAGALAFLLGGSAEDVAALEPILAGLSAVRVHAGPVGAGATLKLMVNALFAVQVAAIGEVLALGEACGLPADRGLELLAPLPVTSKAAVGAGALILAEDHAPRFPVALVEKDLRYAVEAGAGDVVEAARRRYAALVEAGRGGLNLTVIGARGG